MMEKNNLPSSTASTAPADLPISPQQGASQDFTFPYLRIIITLTVVVLVGLLASLVPSPPLLLKEPERQEVIAQVHADPQTPQLREGVEMLKLSAKAVYALDIDSSRALFTKEADFPLLPASTTKIATAMVVLENYDLNQTVDVKFFQVSGKTMGLVQGEKISVRNLLYGLLVFSANDAAEVLAANHPLGRAGFVDQMNKVSKKAGLENTNFTNPAGFDQYLHFSTAKDLVKLSLYALKNPTFAEIVKTLEITVTSVDGRIKHKLANINRLLGSVPGVIGVKTGQTENSGESLVTLVERGGHRVLIAMLGSEDRFGETEKLIEWIFTSFVWETPLDS